MPALELVGLIVKEMSNVYGLTLNPVLGVCSR